MEKIPESKYSIERYMAYKQKLGDFIMSLPFERMIEVQTMLADKGQKLRDKYPNYRRYSMYHSLAQSSIDDGMEKIEMDDFPGEDSVETFIDNLTAQG